MKIFKSLLACGALLAMLGSASAQNLNRAEPGPRLIDGDTINGLIDTVSGGMCVNFAPLGAPAAATDTAFFVAPRSFMVVSASEVHAVAAGGASSLQITKDTDTDAPGAGTNLLTNNSNAGFNLNGTANTVQTGTLTATAASLQLAAGDRLSVDFSALIQSTSGLTVTVCMTPLF